MPYIVRKGTGKKPYRIVNQKTGVTVGTSSSLAKANRSIGYRLSGEKIPKKRA